MARQAGWSQARAAPQVAPPGAGGEQQRQKGAAYLPLRILPNGLTPLLLCSYALSVLPTALNFVLPDVARALTASVLSPRALPWTFGVFVVLFEAIGARLGARSVARDLADWLATVRPCSRGSSPPWRRMRVRGRGMVGTRALAPWRSWAAAKRKKLTPVVAWLDGRQALDVFPAGAVLGRHGLHAWT
jgi:hypothetical protein